MQFLLQPMDMVLEDFGAARAVPAFGHDAQLGAQLCEALLDLIAIHRLFFPRVRIFLGLGA
jgi:hypothetical protein